MAAFDEAEIQRYVHTPHSAHRLIIASQRAIALSLQEPSIPPVIAAPVRRNVHDLDDEDEDPEYQEQLRRALAESQAASQRTPAAAAQSDRSSAPVQSTSQKPPSAFLSTRAELERERLARQKRQHDDIDLDTENARETKRQRVSSSVTSIRTNASSSSSANTRIQPTIASHNDIDKFFYDGELRQTANRYVDPAKDTRPVFRLSEILAPRDDIRFAILSSYAINFTWLYTFFEPKTPVIVVTQDAHGEETIKEVLPEWIKTTPFLRGGFGCMHMKARMIFYKTGRLRVVVSTANLIEYDWRDIENSVWVQDIPARVNALAHDPKADDFAATMTRVLRNVNTAPALITLMRNGHDLPIRRLEELREKWDFSRVKVKLVPSLAGKHEGWDSVIRNGHTALMKAIIDLKTRAPPGKELVLECLGSSIGSYTTQWTNEFYTAAQGETVGKWLAKTRAQRSKLAYPPIKILFPTSRTVRDSVLGESGGGTMFCRRNQWEAAKFPRELFHDSKSKRGRVLMHSKMIIGTFRSSTLANAVSRSKPKITKVEDDDDIIEVAPPSADCVGWAYVGSHNFTPSAWGTLSGSDFTPILNVTNFELGIVFPLRDEPHLANVACWERPPRKYEVGKDEPWVCSIINVIHQGWAYNFFL
ncbi:tyrosyl-DNA phosphodiesterase-domain-containing protein [Cytidiella melzeri]|nr:tyrosyl-DNA phosphodiesterase-domain-containing protein [Cytidiella melzeri]